MKITRAQKDAVISLLREKFNEKSERLYNAYKATHETKIRKEFADLIEAEEKLRSAQQEYDEILTKVREQNENLTKSYCLNGKWVADYSFDHFIDILIKSKYQEPEHPDYYAIERQLELDTLAKDFNLDKFLKKYLED